MHHIPANSLPAVAGFFKSSALSYLEINTFFTVMLLSTETLTR